MAEDIDVRPSPPDLRSGGDGARQTTAHRGRHLWRLSRSYVLAIVLSAIGLSLVTRYPGAFERNVFLVPCFVVAITVLIGGFGPGILATLLSAGATAWVFFAPLGSLSIGDGGDRLRLFAFLVGGGVVSFLGGALRAERRRGAARERELRESEARHRFTVETASDAIFVSDASGRFIEVNAAACEMLGYSHNELLRLGVEDVIDPIDLGRRPVRWDRPREARTITIERLLRRADQSTLFAEISSTILGNGTMQAIARDITDRKHAEEALRASEAELRALVGALSDVILILDREGRVVKIASAAPGELFRPAEEIIGRTLHEVFPVAEADEFLGSIRRALEIRQPVDAEYALVIGEKERWFHATVSPMLEDRVVLLARDITQHKQAAQELTLVEQQLRQAQKMEAVGRLAGGIAHDFNNLLTVIRVNTDLLLDAMADNDPRREGAHEVRRAAERAAALTRQMLAFSRKQVMQPRNLDLNSVVHEMEKMLRRVIGEDIVLDTEPGQSLGFVRADPGQFEQVILNLAVNARDAMPDGGTLRLRTRNVTLGADGDAFGASLRPGEYVVLEVSDTGCGMDEDTQAHMFEPFFTTKPTGQGTGLGLSMVYGIVKQSEGFIRVESALGHGSTFRVFLPRVDAPVGAAGETGVRADSPARAAEAAAPAASAQRETLLLVEDEDAVRALARRILERQGYTVLVAQNGIEAVEVADRHGEDIGLLVTDVVMPGMNGRELAERMVAERPALRVLYLSGYMDDEVVRRGLTDVRRAFLQKPFTSESLLRAVHEVLTREIRPTTPTAVGAV